MTKNDKFVSFVLLLFIFCAFLWQNSWCTSTLSCITSSDEVDALYLLYVATDGSHWNWRSNYTANGIPWNFTDNSVSGSDPCQSHWQGVGCAIDPLTTSCSITSLTLSNYSLYGTLPTTALMNLSGLHIFDLSHNPGLGTTTTTSTLDLSLMLSTWSLLTTLNLAYCELLTSFPSSITTLKNLSYVDMSFNRLTGRIPANMTVSLPRLEYLYLQSNQLTGFIPSPISISSLSSSTQSWLHELDLSVNKLQGTIPYDLGELSYLSRCNLSYNRLTGPIPFSLGNVISNNSNHYFLDSLIIDHNQLTGAIPETIAGLYFLTELSINDNALTSSLPHSLYDMYYLKYFDGQNNQFTGSLPANLFGQWYSIILVLLSNNRFTGTLPDSMSNLKYLTYLYLNDNFFSQSLPNQFWNDSSILMPLYDWISQFNVANNMLTGTVSSTLFTNKLYLQYVDVSSNELTGYLPNTYNVSKFQLFYAYDNLFTGTIPLTWSNARLMYEIDVHHNYLTGAIPPFVFTDYPTLYSLYLQNNILSGQVPWPTHITSLSQRLLIEYLRIDNNVLTGPIADIFAYYPYPPSTTGSFCTWSLLKQFNASHNAFTSTFPQSLRTTPLQSLDLSSNRMTGSIGFPGNGESFRYLVELFLNSNRFGGSLDFLVNISISVNSPTLYPSESPTSSFNDKIILHTLSVIDVSDNSFTSTLPSRLFLENHRLSVFAAVKNCLTGSLSDSLCGSEATRKTLTILALDGLHSSLQCQKKLLPGLDMIDTYVLDSYLSGSLPRCLFTDMLVLQTLHLSGNGIRGSFPENITELSPLLSDLSLSHNRLSGTIPHVIQARQWENLDLSFNILCGEIDAEIFSVPMPVINTTSITPVKNMSLPSLSFQLNRLSGQIPNRVKSLHDVNVLEGNLFECGFDRHSLPRHDPSYESYQCGSNAFNDAVYLWLVVLFVGGMILVFITKEWITTSEIEVLNDSLSTWPAIQELFCTFSFIRRFVAILSIFSVLVLMPLYGIFSGQYNVYNHTYAYSVSFAFDSGLTPTVTMFVLFTCLLVLIFSKYATKGFLSIVTLQSAVKDKRTCCERMTVYLASLNFQFLLRDIQQSQAIQATTNVIPHTQNSLNAPTDEDVMQTTASTSTTRVILPITKRTMFVIACSFLCNLVVVLTVNMAFIYSMTTHYSNTVKTVITISVSLFKLSWNVLFRIFFSACLSLCTGHGESDYDGKFMSPFLLFVSLFNNIIIPCLAVAFISSNCFLYAIIPAPSVSASFSLFECIYELFFYATQGTSCASYSTLTYQTSYQPPFDYNYQCSATLLTSFAGLFVYRFVIGRLLFPLTEMIVCKPLQKQCSKKLGPMHWLTRLFSMSLSAIHRPLDIEVDKECSLQQDINEDVFPCRQHIVSVVTDVAIMLSFGIIFPPLLIIGCGSLWVSTRVLEKILCRMLSLSHSTTVMKIAEKVNDSCHNCLQLVVTALQSLSVLLAGFWSLFLFDSLGESRGPLVAMGMPIALVMLSIVVATGNRYIALPTVQLFDKKSDMDDPSDYDARKQREIEMQVSVDYSDQSSKNPIFFQ